MGLLLPSIHFGCSSVCPTARRVGVRRCKGSSVGSGSDELLWIPCQPCVTTSLSTTGATASFLACAGGPCRRVLFRSRNFRRSRRRSTDCRQARTCGFVGSLSQDISPAVPVVQSIFQHQAIATA